ncbi:hypothetical protein niasHT_018230 [Heterodera trifolii]|uniref:MATH domain-containing protein n=1 Tax=Heterodera trifolii TaxID=157864 RepID=A0ABD2KUR0_9BILA
MFRYDEGQIEIPDTEIEAFKTMLTFIYAKHFNGLDANNLLDVLKAADKYNITGLVKECADFCANVSIQKLPNVFVSFQEARFLNVEALHWADEQCRQNDIECSANNRRKMLGQALFNIRFPLIPKEDFTKSVVSTDVLTMEEVISVYQHYSHPNLSDAPGLFPLKFPTHRRNKSEGTIEMEIEKLSEFAVEEVESQRLSDAVEIGRFSWKILAKIKTKNESTAEKWLGFFLYNTGSVKENWSFKSSATLRIVSQKKGTEDLIGKFNDDIFKDLTGFGFHNFISFAELLDPSKGFYNKDEDKVKLAIDVVVDEPKMEKIISDPNKSNGTLSMEIEKLSEFVREIIWSERKSETVTYVKGMPWKILAEIETKNESTEKWLGFYLLCYTSEKDGNWSRKCSATFRIVSQKSDVEDLKKEFNRAVFNNKVLSRGWTNFISFAELMDPSKGLYNNDEDKVKLAIDFACDSELLDPNQGFYNKDEDKVKLAIDVIMYEPKIEKFISDPNKSNGTLSMEIEKLSEFAREIIWSERRSEAIHIKGMPWKILAEIRTKNENTEKWLGFFLLCDDSEKDGNWSRKCSATLRIVSQKNAVGDFKKEFGEKVFNNKTNDWGFTHFISFCGINGPKQRVVQQRRGQSHLGH